MVNRSVVLAKTGIIKKHLRRIEEKRNVSLATFLQDIDRQESILFNLQMSIQNCLDIASHIISDESLGVPGSNNEMFYLLEENGYIDSEITEKMVKATGFRNLIVHEYCKIELEQVFEIAHNDVKNITEYLASVLRG